MSDQPSLSCYVCKKELHKVNDKDSYVILNSVGAVCLKHHGIKEEYERENTKG